MTLLVACPVILPPRPSVIESWTHRPHAIVLNGAHTEWWVESNARGIDVVDGIPGENIGVAASWNRLFAHARYYGYSHVALISQGTVLKGGTARLAELVDEYADWRGLLTDFAYHVICFSVRLWEQVGPFDERFWPAYYEDSSFTRRLFLAGLHTPDNRMPKVGRDLLDGSETTAAVLHSGLIDPACYGKNAQLYREMWGGDPFKETFTRPDDPTSVDPTNNWSHSDVSHLG